MTNLEKQCYRSVIAQSVQDRIIRNKDCLFTFLNYDGVPWNNNNARWTLPSKLGDNPFIWMLTVDGFAMDIRNAPLELQEQAFQKGLIPYVPGRAVTKTL